MQAKYEARRDDIHTHIGQHFDQLSAKIRNRSSGRRKCFWSGLCKTRSSATSANDKSDRSRNEARCGKTDGSQQMTAVATSQAYLLSDRMQSTAAFLSGARLCRFALQVDPFAYLPTYNKPTRFESEGEHNKALVEICFEVGFEPITAADHYQSRTRGALLLAKNCLAGSLGQLYNVGSHCVQAVGRAKPVAARGDARSLVSGERGNGNFLGRRQVHREAQRHQTRSTRTGRVVNCSVSRAKSQIAVGRSHLSAAFACAGDSRAWT